MATEDVAKLAHWLGWRKARDHHGEYWEKEHDNGFWYWCADIEKHSLTDEEAIALLPALADRGYCPVLAFDDDGNWGVSLTGCQSAGPMPLSIQAEYTDDGDMWKPTIAEAICHTVLGVIDDNPETI